MKKRKGIANAVLAVCMSVFATCGLAQVVQEREPNNWADTAQRLTFAPGGPNNKGIVTVKGVIGNLEGPAVRDVDFYSFEGKRGDVVTINIDDGIGGVRSVDTILGLFGPGPMYNRLAQETDVVPDQLGPNRFKDARISNFNLTADAVYTVGVSSARRFFLTRCCNVMVGDMNLSDANGDYTLIITGVTVPYIAINLEVKPGSSGDALFNPKARGALPVALMGSPQFDAVTVRRDTLKFGRTGLESSYLRCAKEGEDVDGDSYLDLVCHFDNQLVKFIKGDTMGHLTGIAGNGQQIRGQGDLKIIPE